MENLGKEEHPHTYEVPGDLPADEWDKIEVALEGTRFAGVAEYLRANYNAPSSPDEAFYEHSGVANNLEALVTAALKAKQIPYRLARIGKMYARYERGTRLVAFVPLTQEEIKE